TSQQTSLSWRAKSLATNFSLLESKKSRATTNESICGQLQEAVLLPCELSLCFCGWSLVLCCRCTCHTPRSRALAGYHLFVDRRRGLLHKRDPSSACSP